MYTHVNMLSTIGDEMAEIEFMTLANHAEAQNGLLYLSGAGWTDAHVSFSADGASVPFHFGAGVSILVPWTQTNRPLTFEIRVEHEDGGDPLIQLGGELQVGRPVGIPEGSDQRAVFALGGELQFQRPGGYRLVGVLNGEPTRTVSFRVHDAAPQGRSLLGATG
jgi:hypothetical protein